MLRRWFPAFFMLDQAEEDDPRIRTRTVPMQVICVGLARTGTTSLSEALEQLLGRKIYNGFTMFSNSRDIELNARLLSDRMSGTGMGSTREDFDRILGHCAGVTAVVGYINAKQLVAAYPEAKVILTHRDTKSWARSIHDMFNTATEHPSLSSKLWSYIDSSNASVQPMVWHARKFFGYPHPFTENPGQFYHTHSAKIRKLVPPERLLEFRVQEGWEPLCRFLDVPVPDTPFPRSNSVDELRARFGGRRSKLAQVRARRLALLVSLCGVLSYLASPKGGSYVAEALSEWLGRLRGILK